MSGFSADWLALRAPADSAARAETLTTALARAFAGRDKVEIIDLGCGTGANLRFLAPRLAEIQSFTQSWTLVDRDPDLLDRAAATALPPGVERPKTLCLDLAADLESLDLSNCDVVTASALMDLVSPAWFEGLARRCRDAGCRLFPVLTYDGVMSWSPEDPFDESVRDLFNRHQRGDKGFGPALGPAAPDFMVDVLGGMGFRLQTGRSDWELDPESAALQTALLEGFAGAAAELAPDGTEDLKAWCGRRQNLIDTGRSVLRVGHLDILAKP